MDSILTIELDRINRIFSGFLMKVEKILLILLILSKKLN
jgi:hypothetical protein